MQGEEGEEEEEETIAQDRGKEEEEEGGAIPGRKRSLKEGRGRGRHECGAH